ncbi:BREX system P-loop protein BrxC [Achromobacter animicus]|uniref:BREX system P-loop protein BrxC n=1 Tax=Achromobacter animicus TaxID=1389935 RepID=UPI0028AE0867|nr:BREX system P-loop protein BrxC [Achromobacter animicus]
MLKIRDLFAKSIDRPINGVIKADQRDAASIWQELDEYVVTKQLTEYFRKFFDAYLAAADNPNDPVLAARMGVWVSGFFGSGKSHFIKILSYLLENLEAYDPETGATRVAADFFNVNKIRDPMLLADIQRATKGSADVILFNIDAKADSKSERDVILQVFLRVFNEKLGFSGDAPHVAEMERYLVSKGAYETFQKVFFEKKGSTWREERDAVDFMRDEVVAALAAALSMSYESAAAWFDNARDNYKINIENFAKLLREYLDTKPAGHRVIFLVDEVGQFIGANTQLMLTLQTITEQLGTLCQGRAWVIVTSQEDIDAAIGDANKAKSQDFSKIQGRFHTRLSLASSNTDEVIGERLLAKTEEAHQTLRTVYEKQGDIINNQLSFVGTTVNLRGYRDAAEFVAYYPFAPYQFTLLQKIFESIRRVGATGKHLSRGERSLLDAFQSATRICADLGVDALVPLYNFYPSIESFLDTSVKRAIDQAQENAGLELPHDLQLLKALFLIRYVSEVIKPTVDNLATLCLERIDEDKLALKRRIQQSLERLESQKLVSRNGDQWFFLTNEERDVAREIGHVDVSSSEKVRLLSELVFDEILSGQIKVRHRDTKADYEFNRLLDGIPYKQANHQLTIEIITPLGDDYERLSNDANCVLRSADGDGRGLIRLDEGGRLDVELSLYLQIERYVDSPKAATATPSLKKIMADRKDENRERRARLVTQIGELMTSGTFYAKGQKFSSKASSPSTLLDELVNYLVTNTYLKLQLLKVRQTDPIAEIRAVLSADDVAQRTLALGGEEGNPQAIADVREHLNLVAKEKRVLLSDVVDRYSAIPHGWKPEWETVLIISRLFMAGEIKLTLEGSDLDPASAIDQLTKAARFKQVSILKRKLADAGSLKRARDLHKELFARLPREDEDGLVEDWRAELNKWSQDLKSFVTLASQKHHPGKATIEPLLARISKQQSIRDAFEYIEALNRDKDDWLDAGDDKADLTAFYTQQLPTWHKMLAASQVFDANREALIKDTKAQSALKELDALRDNVSPYSQINRIEPLVATVQAVNDALAGEKREKALLSIDRKIEEIQKALTQAQASAEQSNKVLQPLQTLKTKVAGLSDIPQILYLKGQAGDRLDEAMDQIGAAVAATKQAAQSTGTSSKPQSTATGAATASDPPAVAVGTAPKASQTVHAANLSPTSYLETEEEVNAYLDRLRSKLMSVIQAGKRARIQ